MQATCPPYPSGDKDKLAQMQMKFGGVGFVGANYTKYDTQCHIVFNVTMITFWITLLMNE